MTADELNAQDRLEKFKSDNPDVPAWISIDAKTGRHCLMVKMNVHVPKRRRTFNPNIL